MLLKNKATFYCLGFTCLLAFIVILLGVMTRLKEAGLGCPDWPGCYGHLLPPYSAKQSTIAPYENNTFNPSKTWPEMVHRYAAATLVLLSLISSTLIIFAPQRSYPSFFVALTLVALLFLQGLLGKWTVTWHLHPLVVMCHLLGGIGLLSLSWILLWRLKPHWIDGPSSKEKKLRLWIMGGLMILILQIILGGWTSANYAAFICPDFPTCQGKWWPSLNFREGFRIPMDVQKNFEGGILSPSARRAIQVTHRLGALLTTLYFSLMIYRIFRLEKSPFLRRIALLLALLLVLQLALGLLNVVWVLPLAIALAHNGVAVLLLLCLISLMLYLTPPQTI